MGHDSLSNYSDLVKPHKMREQCNLGRSRTHIFRLSRPNNQSVACVGRE